MFFGQNFTDAEIKNSSLRDFQESLHPVLKKRLQTMIDSKANGNFEVGGNQGHVDRAGVEGSHSELVALDQALKARERSLGRPATEADLKSFLLTNKSLDSRNAEGAPYRCLHCWNLTDGVTTVGHD